MSEIMQAIEAVGKSFEDLKKTNEQMLAEERKGNEVRAKELKDALEKISDDLSQNVKQKEIAEKRLATLQERLEIVEAVNSRPGKTMQDKIHSEHKDLFFKWLRSKGTDQNAVDQYRELVRKSREVKDVSLTDAAGGFALPEEISRSIDNLVLKLSAIAGNVKNVQVGTSDYKELISVNDATYTWAAEADSRSATAEPTLRNRAPTWGELYAYMQASNWSIEDLFFNVESWLVENAAEGFAVGLATAIYTGNGSGKPTGMFAAAPTSGDDYASPERAHGVFEYIPLSSPSSPFTSTGITAKTLIDLVYQLRAPYRNGAKFAMNSVTQGHVRKLTDTTGQFLWQPSMQAGQPDRLLGYELFTWEDLGNPTTSTALAAVFGDFRRAYTLATRSGMSIVRDNITAPGFTKFYISRRYGGIVTNNNALKIAKVSVS
jgi:HK97 family phage major capsid protein